MVNTDRARLQALAARMPAIPPVLVAEEVSDRVLLSLSRKVQAPLWLRLRVAVRDALPDDVLLRR